MLPFSHLHCHTQYSLLDGAAPIERLIDQAVALGLQAVAITDHGNLFGVPEFYTTARKKHIKPIIGCEFYVAPSGMTDRTDRTRYHQVLLARNEEGYRNLMRLSSDSFTKGYYYKPRIDMEALRAHATGLIATTCCLQGEVLQTILKKGEDAGRRVFEQYLDIFGNDYYIEIQDHGIPEQKICNDVLLRWSAAYDVPIIATNDVHYVAQEDAAAHDVLLCLQTGRDLTDPGRMRFPNDRFYLKSVEEMRTALSGLDSALQTPALVTTCEVADKCSFELSTGSLLMPHYPIPPSYEGNMDAYLRDLVFERAPGRYPEMGLDVVERLNHELGIVESMGYAGYFLIVQDFTNAARELGVRVGPGRGSAAGSAAAYCLGITNIDPLKYDLLFERFLNPERISLPDIDIDFDDRGRSRVIDYVVHKYGRESVCQIITFGTMGSRSVIRDVSRVLNIPLSEADRIAKLIPEGPKITLEDALRDVPEFRMLRTDPNEQLRNLLHYAAVLEGSARHTGVHAAGVIIAPGQVRDYVPVAVTRGKAGAEDIVTTQFDGNWVEHFGLLKMDFLGLKTLTVLEDTLDLIRRVHGIHLDLDEIPLDCEKTLGLFQRGDTVSIFQFESEGMREWMRKLRPTTIDDLIAMNALYRPGPMSLIPNYIDRKHGREKVTYPHPMLEPILKPTYGIPVYQEQVMQIAQVMGGYTLGGADILRRAMGKKKQSVMDEQRKVFVQGASERGVTEKTAHEVFDMMDKFAGYGFNKSHSAAYSLVAYQTAYLKAHYPAEFMASAMTNEMADNKKLAVVLEEARKLGLSMLPPSVNQSQANFTVEEGKIRFGLGAVKGVGTAAIEAVIDAREKAGAFASLFALTRSVDLRAINKKALECLASAGALDELEGHRAQIVAALDDAVQHGQRIQADLAAGQNSLFGDGASGVVEMEPRLPVVDPWPRAKRLKAERDLIGVYVSGHPLEAYLAEVRAFATAALGEAETLIPRDATESEGGNRDSNGSGTSSGRGSGNGRYRQDDRPKFSFCGIITDVQKRTTRSGKPMVFATLADFTGQGEIVCFSTILDRVQQYLEEDQVVLVRGGIELRGGSIKIVADDVLPMWKVREQLVKSIVLRVRPGEVSIDQIERLRALCDENRGHCKLYFDIDDPDLPTPQRIRSRSYVIDPSPALMKGITTLFGSDNVVLEGEAT